MKLGDKFYSYKDFEERLKQHETTVHAEFWVRDCLTLKTQTIRYPNGPAAGADPKLRYSHVRLACVLGGREFALTGSRKASKKQGCQASMTVRLDKSGKYLEVVSVNDEHNHVLLRADAAYEPSEDSGVRMEDFSRFSVNDGLKEDFYECVAMLKDKHDCSVSILCDEGDNVFCLFFQSNEMKNIFEAYPDVLFIEGVNNGNDTVVTYLFLVEDSEGNGQIVGVAIMLQMDESVIEGVIKEFSEGNACIKKVKIIMAERGCSLANAFATKFPQIKVQIPFFHSLNYIREEVCPNLLKISSRECNEIVKSWKILLFSNSQDIYKNELENFIKYVPKSILTKFRKTWQPIEEQWTLFNTINFRLMSNNSNYRAEIARHHYKSVITKYPDFRQFVQMFFACVNALKAKQTKPTEYKSDSDEPQSLYKEYLSKYAYEKVETELTESKDCNNFQIIGLEKAFAPSSEGTLSVESNSCNCLFRVNMQLPCRHILKFRSIIYLPLFDESLCDEKWSRGYHSESVTAEPALNKRIKIEEMKDVADAIAKVCVDVPMDIYSKRLSFIKGLKRKWIGEKGEN